MVGTRRSARNEKKVAAEAVEEPNPEVPQTAPEPTVTPQTEDASTAVDSQPLPTEIETVVAPDEPIVKMDVDTKPEGEEAKLTEAVEEDQPPASNDDAGSSSDSSERCPACPEEGVRKVSPRSASKESWVACEGCQQWFHWDCVGGGDLSAVDKWYCSPCLKSNPAFTITLKPPARKSSRKRTQPNYISLSEGLSSDPNKWVRLIQTKKIQPDTFKRMKGEDVNSDWLKNDENAMKEPVVIEVPEGLGMSMPGWAPIEGVEGEFGIDDVARIVGPDTPVEVIDVASQATSPGWTLSKWAEYYNTPPNDREKIRNVISLEISGTPLAQYVIRPTLVKEIDWTELVWPANRKGKGQFPKVQLYCLMSVAQCWTDFHVDFAGSSVFYHVLRGAKVFYFIRPTKANLAAYERWSGSELQSTTWLGDLVDEVIKVELKQGHTMIIPTGWIHAVYTPEDSLVFGGNFLHSYNIATQLRVRDIEIATRVPKKFRFPFFQRICWYAGEKFNKDLKSSEGFPPRILEGLRALSDFLMSEAHLIEKSTPGNESARRDAKEQVPSDKVKDAPALAREFRWRINMAIDGESGDEGASRLPNGLVKNGAHPRGSTRSKSVSSGTTSKRKRGDSLVADDEAHPDPKIKRGATFKNFEPRPWDNVKKLGGQVERSQNTAVPSDVDLGDDVVSGKDAMGEFVAHTDSVVKTRRYWDHQGKLVVEREKITRVRETWTPGASASNRMDVDDA